MIIVDRFEEKWAVLEYGRITFNIPRDLLPDETREGDVLNIIISIDHQSTAEQEDGTDTLVNDVFED